MMKLEVERYFPKGKLRPEEIKYSKDNINRSMRWTSRLQVAYKTDVYVIYLVLQF
jgi:hypothetical protein